MSLSAGLLMVAAAQGSPWDDPAPTGRWAGSTAKLASELLPPEMAKDAVSHRVATGFIKVGLPSSVRFEGRAARTNDGFCSRKTYYVSIGQKTGSFEGEPEKPVVGSKLRIGNCDGIFAYMNPGAELEDGKSVFRWLSWSRSIARGHGPMPFKLTCRSETTSDRCAIGARLILATLPLENTSVITNAWRRPAHNWDVSIVETIPGQLYWDVKIDATPGNASIGLEWKMPAPF